MSKVLGETESLNTHTISEIEKIYDLKVSSAQTASLELINTMIELSREIQREIAVFIDRKGNIQLVTVGTWDKAKIPTLRLKRGMDGFCGIRCIHTHPNGNPHFSTADLSALVNLKLDAIISLGLSHFVMASIAYLVPIKGQLTDKYEQIENITISNLLKLNFSHLNLTLEKELKFKGHQIELSKERTLLVIIDWQNSPTSEIDEIIDELKSLAYTAGLEVLDVLIQKRDRKDPAYMIGKGKLNEMALKVQEMQIDCVIFEDTLSPSQQTNLMEYLGVKVLDRTNLILDIFAQRATSKEGKLQVELAQLTYLLPRLSGQGIILSRLGGGVGTRGPGETKLETDRRHIRKKIQSLNKELELVKKHRNLLQTDRKIKSIPMIALVGYTNAGKSSLLNKLAKEDLLVEDKLFATLDTTTRKIILDSKENVLLTDTVGFIRNLPHQLIAAFKSTLEEVKLADLLLHVIDITNENIDHYIETVQDVLKELECLDKPVIYVFNKYDLANNEIIIYPDYHPSCLVSAKTGYGLENLSSKITDYFYAKKIQIKVHIPYNQGYLLDKCYQDGEVEIEQYTEYGTLIRLTAFEKSISNEIKKYIVME